jgi:nicotinate-nucleotide adenylyltransferase
MGGSFDPIHEGHLQAAYAASRTHHLSKVLFVPCGMPPHRNASAASAAQRYEMTAAAVGTETAFLPSRTETDREGESYTADTLTEIAGLYPDHDIIFIIGEDKLAGLPNWYKSEALFALCAFGVVRRAPEKAVSSAYQRHIQTLRALGARLYDIPMPYNAAASADIRRTLASGMMPNTLSTAIQAYIALNGLYHYPAWLPDAAAMLTKLCDDLPPARFAHSLNTCYTARELALIHGTDPQKAAIAALLHDCAKSLDPEQMRIILNTQMNEQSLPDLPALLHSHAGKYMARDEYHIADETILDAIACHTTGKPGMNDLDMILYLADKIEPGRPAQKRLEALRALSRKDLRKAVLLSMRINAAYLESQDKPIDPLIYTSISDLKSKIKGGS